MTNGKSNIERENNSNKTETKSVKYDKRRFIESRYGGGKEMNSRRKERKTRRNREVPSDFIHKLYVLRVQMIIHY